MLKHCAQVITLKTATKEETGKVLRPKNRRFAAKLAQEIQHQ
jgi:hypothetical protein